MYYFDNNEQMTNLGLDPIDCYVALTEQDQSQIIVKTFNNFYDLLAKNHLKLK